MIVSPDVGGVVRARSLASRIDADLAIVDKRRERAGVSEVMNIIGDVAGRDCILFDDIVDTAGTLCNAAEALMNAGAKSVAAYVTHGVLSGPAVERVSNSVLTSLVVTDSIAQPKHVTNTPNIRILSVAPLVQRPSSVLPKKAPSRACSDKKPPHYRIILLAAFSSP